SCRERRTLVTRPAGRPARTTCAPSSGSAPLSISKPTHRSFRPPHAEHPHLPLLRPALGEMPERPLADEVVLVRLDEPRHVRVKHVRLRVGVLADDHALLLEPDDPLRVEP